MYRSKMIIPILQIGPLVWQFAKIILPQFWLLPNIGKFIVKFHQIDSLDAMVRPWLALDTSNIYDTLDLGWGVEPKMVSNDYLKRISLVSNTV